MEAITDLLDLAAYTFSRDIRLDAVLESSPVVGS